MSVVVRFAVPAREFALGDVLDVGEAQVRLETMVPTGNGVVPYVWVDSEGAEAVERALESSTLARDVEVLDDVDGETLFGVDWSEDVDGILSALESFDAALLEGTGSGDDWQFRVRFREHETLSAFYRYCTESSIDVTVLEVNDPVETTGEGFGLTRDQREALAVALREGYFEVPRKVTLVELAAQLGVSDTAASQRIRRGLSSLVETTVAATGDAVRH